MAIQSRMDDDWMIRQAPVSFVNQIEYLGPPPPAPHASLIPFTMCFDIASETERDTIVVVGLGMVALSFIEKIKEYDIDQIYQIKVFSDEPHGESPTKAVK